MSGIRERLLLLVAVATGPLFLFILYQSLEERRRAGLREREEARRLVQLFAAEHRRVVSDAQRILFVLAQGPTVQRGQREACVSLFQGVVEASPGYVNVLLTDREGTVAAAARPGAIDAEDRALLEAALRSTSAVGPIRVTGSGPFPTFSAAHLVPLRGPGPPRLLLTTLDMGWVAREMAATGLGERARVTLWDPSGRVLMRHPDPEGFAGRDASASETWKAVQATGGEGTAEADGGDGVRRLYGFTRLTPNARAAGPVLALAVPTDVALADSSGATCSCSGWSPRSSRRRRSSAASAWRASSAECRGWRSGTRSPACPTAAACAPRAKRSTGAPGGSAIPWPP